MAANAGLRPALACCQAVISSLPRARSAAGGETIRALCAAMSPPKTCPTGIDSPSERFIAPSGPRTPRGSSRKPKEGNAHEQRASPHVQIRDPAQIPRRRRHHRRRRGRHAAGVARADRDLEVPVDLADQGYFPRVRRRLRQEGQRHVGRPPQARRARRRRRGGRLPGAGRRQFRRVRRRPRRHRLLVWQEQGGLAVRHPAVDGLGRARYARLVLLRRRRSALQRADQ